MQTTPTVVLSEEAGQAAGIRVVAVSGQEFEPRLDAPGIIRPDAQRSVAVRAPVAGRLTRVLVDIGHRVGQGAPLATLSGPDVSATIARQRTADAKAGVARRALDRADRLLRLQAISEAERESRAADSEAADAEQAAAHQDLRALGIQGTDASAVAEVAAPMAGVVLEKSASPGLQVERDAPLFVLADLSSVWAVVDVYEKDLGQVARAGSADVRSDAYPEAVFRGSVSLVEPAIDEARMAQVRVVLDNRDGRLRPGLLVTVSLPLRAAAGGQVTVVPAAAIQRLSGLTAAFVEKGPGQFELRTVQTGRERAGMVEILSGVTPGERVVVEGTFYLKGELLKHTLTGEEDERERDGEGGAKEGAKRDPEGEKKR